jgi:uncharacterized protein YhaN
MVAAVLGFAAVTVGLVLSLQLVWAIGLVVTLFAGIQLGTWWLQKRRVEQRVTELEVPRLEAERESAYGALQRLCADLPVDLAGDGTPDPEILADVQEIKALQGKLDEQDSRVDNLQRVIRMNEQAIESLATACGVPADSDMLQTVSHLEEQLGVAERKLRIAAEATDSRPALIARKERLLRELEEIRGRRNTTLELLSQIGDGNTDRGIKRLEERRVSRNVADHLEQSLDDDFPRWRQIEDAIGELTPEGMTHFTDEARVERTARLENLAAQIRELSEQIARLEEESRTLQGLRSLDDIESEIAIVDAELEKQRRRRDRLFLLASIVRRADTQFRMKHQPDVVRLAEAHLRDITGGRYERMLVDDETDRLIVFEKGGLEPLVVDEPLSQGTRDQIYLALRFAIVDHLDRDQERLPLFLDEVFVNWDEDRRALGLQILKDMSDRRQIFLFTCHPWLADELVRGLDAAYVAIQQ